MVRKKNVCCLCVLREDSRLSPGKDQYVTVFTSTTCKAFAGAFALLGAVVKKKRKDMWGKGKVSVKESKVTVATEQRLRSKTAKKKIESTSGREKRRKQKKQRKPSRDAESSLSGGGGSSVVVGFLVGGNSTSYEGHGRRAAGQWAMIRQCATSGPLFLKVNVTRISSSSGNCHRRARPQGWPQTARAAGRGQPRKSAEAKLRKRKKSGARDADQHRQGTQKLFLCGSRCIGRPHPRDSAEHQRAAAQPQGRGYIAGGHVKMSRPQLKLRSAALQDAVKEICDLE